MSDFLKAIFNPGKQATAAVGAVGGALGDIGGRFGHLGQDVAKLGDQTKFKSEDHFDAQTYYKHDNHFDPVALVKRY